MSVNLYIVKHVYYLITCQTLNIDLQIGREQISVNFILLLFKHNNCVGCRDIHDNLMSLSWFFFFVCVYKVFVLVTQLFSRLK